MVLESSLPLTFVSGRGRLENLARDDCRENAGRSTFGVGELGADGAKPILEASSSVVILVSGTGRLEKRAAEDCLEKLGREGVVMPSRGVGLPPLEGLIDRARLELSEGNSATWSGSSIGKDSVFFLGSSAT